ncbi:MAG: type II CAAX endopeptidase family protein [Lutisporaceae bacterium]
MEKNIRKSNVLRVLEIAGVFVLVFLLNVVWSTVVTFVYTIMLAIKGVNITDVLALTEKLYSAPDFLMFVSMYNLLAIGIVALFWKLIDKQNIKELGFARTNKVLHQLLSGILAAIVAIAAVIIFGSLFKIITFSGYGLTIFGTRQIIWALVIGAITFLMVGFGEEAVYRSYIQNHLVKMIGSRYGLIVAALIFTVAHLFTYAKPLDFLDVFLAGIILGYAFLLTKSIYLPASFHFMWDFLQVNIFRIQDYSFYKGPVLIIFNNTGDLIINKYNFGNQLEVIFVIVEIIILILMYTCRNKLSRLAQA